MLFKTSKIQNDEETVADNLISAREEKKLSIADVSKKLSIKTEYLAALENGNYSIIPSGVYEKTFLKKYSSFLGLNSGRIIEKYAKERNISLIQKNDVFSRKKIKGFELLVFPKILKNIIIILFVSLLFLYLGYYLTNTFSVPLIEIFEPADNFVTSNNSVTVTGHTDPKTQISINEKQILKDGKGYFTEQISLKKGINTIIISAQNKYSQKKIIQKQILVK